jgi:hypothetical protein
MLWANHADKIAQIGAYIRDCIRPVIETREGMIWRWELKHDSFGAHPVKKSVRFGIPVFLVFIGPPVFGLAYSFSEVVLEGNLFSRMEYGIAALMTVAAATGLIPTLGKGRFHTPEPELESKEFDQGAVPGEHP